MEEKKLTDEEIVKAFEYCNYKARDCGCTDCPYSYCVKDDIRCNMKQMRIDTLDLINRQKTEIERLTEELKNLDWYKMWHKKFQKEIEDLTTELETYRPTKLSGHGQCKCGVCGAVSWTDWFSRYKGKTICDKCLKEITATEEKQAVKDTAKEILITAIQLSDMCESFYEFQNRLIDLIEVNYGVEIVQETIISANGVGELIDEICKEFTGKYND